MPLKVSFTIEADDEPQLGRIMAAFGLALQAKGGEPLEAAEPLLAAPADTSASINSGDWYRTNGRTFLAGLSPSSWEALAVIVREAPDVPMARLREATGRHGTALAGTLGSIGAACKRLAAPRPFTADHKRGFYHIDPAVAEALLPLLGEGPASR